MTKRDTQMEACTERERERERERGGGGEREREREIGDGGLDREWGEQTDYM